MFGTWQPCKISSEHFFRGKSLTWALPYGLFLCKCGSQLATNQKKDEITISKDAQLRGFRGWGFWASQNEVCIFLMCHILGILRLLVSMQIVRAEQPVSKSKQLIRFLWTELRGTQSHGGIGICLWDGMVVNMSLWVVGRIEKKTERNQMELTKSNQTPTPK